MHEYWTQPKYTHVALSMGLLIEMGKPKIQLAFNLLLYTQFCCMLFDENNTSRVVLRANKCFQNMYIN